MSYSLHAPWDVRFMNQAAVALVAGCALVVAAAGAWWVMHHPVFSFSRIVVQGDLLHNNAVSLRANVAPQLTGNFFTLDMDSARRAFEQAPWVRRAQVNRVFPGTLHVVLEEHVPVAFWESAESGVLINQQGETFEADAADLDAESLPVLKGPVEQAAELLSMHRILSRELESMQGKVRELSLTPRGDWHLTLAGGARIALGAGPVSQVRQRTRQFVQTLPQVAAAHGRRVEALESADLRHRDGYALRLRGVSTVRPGN